MCPRERVLDSRDAARGGRRDWFEGGTVEPVLFTTTQPDESARLASVWHSLQSLHPANVERSVRATPMFYREPDKPDTEIQLPR
jgi:hypothetical protein